MGKIHWDDYDGTVSASIAFGIGDIILVALKLLEVGYGVIVSWATIIAIVVIGVLIILAIYCGEKVDAKEYRDFRNKYVRSSRR